LILRQKQLGAVHASYAAHHPDLRALLSDFLQHLLIDKPADVLDFCVQYFDAFSVNYSNVEIAGSGTSGFGGSGIASSGVVGGGSGNLGQDIDAGGEHALNTPNNSPLSDVMNA